jgi:hypothetical protein
LDPQKHASRYKHIGGFQNIVEPIYLKLKKRKNAIKKLPINNKRHDHISLVGSRFDI